MERPTFLTQKDREMIESLGGETYELEDEFTSQELHYSDKGGHRERSRANKELAKRIVSLGLYAVSLLGCVPSNSEAYYNPFTDQIDYITEPSEANRIHEETHQERAHNHPYGHIGWGIQYTLDPDFRCQEETQANSEAGIEPVDNHPYCQNLSP